MKKIISLFLAFAMVFSLAMPAMAADDTRTIYFENTGNWSTVYAYAWDASAAPCLGNWPGTAMTKVEGETNIYSIEVSTAAINVIFHNANGTQTADLTIPTDGNDLYSYSTGAWSKYAKKSGDVTASYTPTITINDVTVSEHADYPGAVSVDKTNSTYTVTVPADVESVMFAVYISGENLDTIPTTSTDYQVSATGTNCRFHGGRYNETIGKIQVNMEASGENVGTYDLQYTTNGGANWTDTDWNVVIQQAEADPTYVSFNVMLKGIDSSTGTEITDTWLGYLDYGAVDNSAPSSTLLLTGDHTLSGWIVPSGYQTPADVSLTVTDTDGDGVGELTSNSSHATVTTETIDGETVYVITVTLEKDESTGDTPTLPEIIYLKAEGAKVASIASFFDSNGDHIVDENNTPMAAAMTAVEGEEDIFSVATGSFPEGAAAIVFYTDNGGSEQLNLSGVTGDIDMFTFGTEVNANGQTLGTWGTYTPSSTGDTTATIAGVSITVDDTTYTSGNVTITPDSTVTLTVTGTNLQNGTEDNLVAFASGVSAHVTSSYFEFSTDGTTATLTVPNGSFVNSSNFEISYTNDGQQSWTSAGIYVTYDAGTPDTYDVNIAVVENGTVSADMQTAAEDDIVTLTWTTEGTYELDNIVVKDADGNEVTITDKGLTAWTFAMPASDVTVTATFKEIATTSADIAWGSLAYTYTDGENGAKGAWSNDGSEKAGTVTVTNTGTTAITASVEYKQATGYEEISGYFEGTNATASQTIEAGKTGTFTLTLSGEPKKALNGETVGTVTVTIN